MSLCVCIVEDIHIRQWENFTVIRIADQLCREILQIFFRNYYSIKGKFQLEETLVHFWSRPLITGGSPMTPERVALSCTRVKIPSLSGKHTPMQNYHQDDFVPFIPNLSYFLNSFLLSLLSASIVVKSASPPF